MSSSGIEVIDTIIFSVDRPKSLFVETVDGSRIDIREHRITLLNFLRYTEAQKVSWDLENSTFGQRAHVLCLVIPHQSMTGAAWIPLVRTFENRPTQLDLIRTCAVYARELLHRELPAGETDQL